MTTSSISGLSSQEAPRRFAQIGPNAVVEPHVSPVARIARRFWEPVPWMLEAAIVLQLAIGERLEAVVIAVVLVFNVALGVFQEGRAGAALAALKSKLALKAFVRPDGRWIEAPALRKAQMGIAVSSATDVAKSVASMVLMEPGLEGIVTAIEEGRRTFQRILTYTLNALVKKFELVLLLGAGLIMSGHAILTPMLMALLLITGDFLTMSLTTERATPSPNADVWRLGAFSAAAAILGLFGLTYTVSVIALGKYVWALSIGDLPTLAFITLVFASQATVYVVRERGHIWHSRPGGVARALDDRAGTCRHGLFCIRFRCSQAGEFQSVENCLLIAADGLLISAFLRFRKHSRPRPQNGHTERQAPLLASRRP